MRTLRLAFKETLKKLAEFPDLAPFPNVMGGESFKIHEHNDSVKDLDKIIIRRLKPEQFSAINEIAAECLDRYSYQK